MFRAVADDDTLVASFGPLVPEPKEQLIEAATSAPWPTCIGLGVCWAWRLTNQQGYSDGVRLEFSEPGGALSATVEFIVAASAIQIYLAAPCAAE